MTSDDRAPRELQELARRESAGLGAEARARVLASVRERGPAVVRRARVQRQVGQGVAAASLVLLAVSGARLLSPEGPEGPAAPAVAQSAARPCEGRAAAPARFEPTDDGEQVLELGARAFVRAEAGSRVAVSENAACRLVLALDHGRVYVHARDLGQGELLVVTAEARVAVRGTVFGVARQDAELTVDVAEGLVEVTASEHAREAVRPGQRLRRRGATSAREVLPEAAERRLLDAVYGPRAVGALEAASIDEDEDEDDDLAQRSSEVRRKRRGKKRAPARLRADPPALEAPSAAPAWGRAEVRAEAPAEVPAEPAPESLDELLALAERLKRSGDLLGARRTLRRAGEMSGPDARAAWIALARLELQSGNTAEVRRAVREYGRRGGGPLEPEGSWLMVRAEERAGRLDEARAEAGALIHRWPGTPQAEEARRWLGRADAGSSP